MGKESDRHNLANFEHLISHCLDESGLHSVSQYCPPNSSRRIDVYIPSYPRTIVEYTSNWNSVRMIRNKLMHDLDAPMFDILIVILLQDMNEEDMGKLREYVDHAKIELIHQPLPKSQEDFLSTAREISKDIRQIRTVPLEPISIHVDDCIFPFDSARNVEINDELLKHIREKGAIEPILVSFEMTDGRYTVIDGARRLAAAKELNIKTIPAIRMTTNLDSFWIQREKMFNLQEGKPAFDKESVPHLSHKNLFSSGAAIDSQKSEVDSRPDANFQQIIGVELAAMMSIIQDRAVGEVIEHEYTRMCEEYNEQHFTSCGLRVGRLLELLVYGLARNWGVPLNEPVFQGLRRIENRTNQLKKKFLDFTFSENVDDKTRIKTEINKIVKSLSGDLIDLPQETRELNRDDMKNYPRNSRAILQDIRSTYSHVDGVIDAFGRKNELLNSYQKIYDIRNDAAHASIELKKKELQKDDVDEMITNIRQFMIKLTNIGAAISKSEQAKS